jgi:hypothetical protein
MGIQVKLALVPVVPYIKRPFYGHSPATTHTWPHTCTHATHTITTPPPPHTHTHTVCSIRKSERFFHRRKEARGGGQGGGGGGDGGGEGGWGRGVRAGEMRWWSTWLLVGKNYLHRNYCLLRNILVTCCYPQEVLSGVFLKLSRSPWT